jgi:ATP-dependent exoDNAse (exonuclease V) beta subunit
MMETGNFKVYRSSAGSGKTFTLVKEYLRIALGDPKRFRNILAITFTNKAAAEMKSRVLKYLTEMQQEAGTANSSTHKVLIPLLSKETGIAPEELKRRAAEVHSLILHNYSDFSITTIDSLMHRVVRTFTYDLRLSSGFEVELDSDKLILEAVNSIIHQAGTREEITKVLLGFLRQRTEDEKSFNIEKEVFDLSKKVINMEDTPAHLALLADIPLKDLMDINTGLKDYCKAFEKEVSETASTAARIIRDNDIDQGCFYRGSSGIGKWFLNLADQQIDKISPNTYQQSTINDDKWLSAKCPSDKAEIIMHHKDDFIRAYHAIQKISEEKLPVYKLYSLINGIFYPMALLNAVATALTNIKQEENLLMISDFNYLINRIVEKEPVPFIYERLGTRFRNFMIDEFQDTSIFQWHNLIPLLENMLADGHFCMLAGDGKQAIYRWRNGEVEQFAALPNIYPPPQTEDFKQKEKALERNYAEVWLDVNYRSEREVIEFNNKLYRFIGMGLNENIRKIYHHAEQEIPAHKKGGFVSINFNDFEEDATGMQEWVMNVIRRVLEDGYRYRDIGLLCRSNDQAGMLASFMLRQGIPVISAESLLLNAQPVVLFMLALLAYIRDGGDDVSRASVVRYLAYSGRISSEDLHAQLDKAREKNSKFSDYLLSLGYDLAPARLIRMSLYDLCEELVRIFNLQKPADPYIQFFLDAVRNYICKKNGHIGGFLKWWEEKSSTLSISVPGSMDAVNVSTIHKSKGLEFPVVILPYRDSAKNNTISRFWTRFEDTSYPALKSVLLPAKKELMETSFGELYTREREKTLLDFINLMYVATTRAAERLYIQVRMPSKAELSAGTPQDVLAAFLSAEGLYSESVQQYTFGKEEKRENVHPSVKGLSSETLCSNAWQDRILLSLRYGNHSNQKGSAGIIWGNLMHTALSRIHRSSDLTGVIAEMRRQGLIPASLEEEFVSSLSQLMGNDEIAALFDAPGELYTEAEILTADGSIYRPDRICIHENAALIIDFKTGKADPSHEEQILHYASLLREMGYSHCRCILLYLSEANITEVAVNA